MIAYRAAIEAVNGAVHGSDLAAWFPKVVERTRDARGATTVFEVDGSRAAYGTLDDTTLPTASPEFDEPHANAMLHIVRNPARGCAIFACPVWSALDRGSGAWKAPLQDVVVGFASTVGFARRPALDITPAWDGHAVYPMIGLGGRPHRFSVPPGAELVLCACLCAEHRRAVATHSHPDPASLRQATPALGPVLRGVAAEQDLSHARSPKAAGSRRL